MTSRSDLVPGALTEPGEVVSRRFRGASDFRAMQDVLVREYAHAETRAGDFAWRARSRTHFERTFEITLWCRDGELVAWVWFRSNGGCDLYVVSELRESVWLWEELLDTVERTADKRRDAGDDLRQIYMWFANERDRAVVVPLLTARGFDRDDEDGGHLLIQEDLSTTAAPTLPPGYECGWVDDATVGQRVELHRAAFAPSDLTVAIYRAARNAWPYRPELDRIIRSESGQVVAACTAWLDDANRAGLLEPIGTHPEHQNRGLGRAVVADALCALRAAGAETAQVGTSGPAAQSAYTAAGFRPWKQEHMFRKRLSPMAVG